MGTPLIWLVIMGNQRIQLLTEQGALDGTDVYIFPAVEHQDLRGTFQENFKFSRILEISGIEFKPCQGNLVNSKKNVFRGIHQSNLQSKLVTCVLGEIIDFAIDLRVNSLNYGNQYALTLDSNKSSSVLIPKGFGHGYFVKSEFAIVSYLVDHEYVPNEEKTFNGRELVTNMELCDESKLILSEKDSQAPLLTI
jgi:dTDP-4-dehydrorhamnose 3,5-epimerase